MKKRQTNQIQVVFGFSGGLQEDLERYQGVMAVAQAEGWHVLGVHEQFERSLTRLADAGAVQGVIGEFMSEAWLGDLPARLPLVHVGRSGFSAGVAAVTFDWRAIGRVAAAHFREMGYGRVRVYELPGQPLPDEVYAGLEAFGAASVLRVRGGGELGQLLAAPGDKPVGMLCPSDFAARQVIQAAERAGVAVPEALGVLGIGDRFLDRIAVERGISSIPLPHQALGRGAGELLRELMRGKAPRQIQVVPGEVVARETTLRDSHPRALVVRVEGVFRRNLADPPDLDALSRRVGMSRRAFERAFRDQSGTTPYQFFLGMRLEESQRLLRETDWTVTRIGERVGYAEPSRFSAFFKRMTGMSPTEWRGSRGRELP
ncbi:MAG: helix-turn-helix domain-containing protein [Verrucomicrobia bacterium]|nr:helix-turn-helix domain-containing protein [Verrucomicrobiota bacterium]MCH8525867.1 helix-turn-helix domain-containing protein [Kiritimatiellia bacterium]